MRNVLFNEILFILTKLIEELTDEQLKQDLNTIKKQLVNADRHGTYSSKKIKNILSRYELTQPIITNDKALEYVKTLELLSKLTMEYHELEKCDLVSTPTESALFMFLNVIKYLK